MKQPCYQVRQSKDRLAFFSLPEGTNTLNSILHEQMPNCTTNLHAIQSQMGAFFHRFCYPNSGGCWWTSMDIFTHSKLVAISRHFFSMHSNSPFFLNYAQYLVLRHMWRRSILSFFR